MRQSATAQVLDGVKGVSIGAGIAVSYFGYILAEDSFQKARNHKWLTAGICASLLTGGMGFYGLLQVLPVMFAIGISSFAALYIAAGAALAISIADSLRASPSMPKHMKNFGRNCRALAFSAVNLVSPRHAAKFAPRPQKESYVIPAPQPPNRRKELHPSIDPEYTHVPLFEDWQRETPVANFIDWDEWPTEIDSLTDDPSYPAYKKEHDKEPAKPLQADRLCAEELRQINDYCLIDNSAGWSKYGDNHPPMIVDTSKLDPQTLRNLRGRTKDR